MKTTTHLGRLFACSILVLITVLTIAPTPCNLRIAEYPGSSQKEGREDTCDVCAVDHETIQPYDPATGQANSVRQHKPLTVLKEIDKASPGFHKALATGQLLRHAILDFYRMDPITRQEVKYYTITLDNVRIVGMKTLVPTSFLPENETYGHMEEVRMVYETIEWNWIPDSVVEQDEWRFSPASPPAAALPVGTNSTSAVTSPQAKP